MLRSPRFAGALGVVHRQPSVHATEQADLRDAVATGALLGAASPSVVVHTVGLTDVDACERDPAGAYATSVLTTRNVAEWLRENLPTALLVYISSDQVYSGPGPHTESRPAPANAYGASKHAGELAAMRAPRHLVLRTNFVGHSRGARRSWSDWIAASVRDESEIRVSGEACFSPLHVSDLVDLIAEAVDLGLEGTFNFGARDDVTKFEFAQKVAEIVSPGGSRLVHRDDSVAAGRAIRETDLRLDVGKAERALGRPLPTIARCLELLAAEPVEEVADVA